MNKLHISNFRKNKENKVEHIKLDIVDSIFLISIKYIVNERIIISERAFPGDDTDFVTQLVEREFIAEFQSKELLQIIKEINSLSNPVLEITFDDSNSRNKLESIEFRQKSSELIDVENKLNNELDHQDNLDKDYLDYLDDFYNGE